MTDKTAIAIFMAFNAALAEQADKGAIDQHDAGELMSKFQDITVALLKGETLENLPGIRSGKKWALDDNNEVFQSAQAVVNVVKALAQ